MVPGLPGALDRLIREALAPDPDARIPSAREFSARCYGLSQQAEPEPDE